MRIGTDHLHNVWDNTLQPAAKIGSGDRIEVDLLDASGGQLNGSSTASDIAAIDHSRVNPVTGPIWIAGARAGDALAVRVLELDVDTWGWCGFHSRLGLLAGDFKDPELVHICTVDGLVTLPFGPVIRSIPMIGTLGVALPAPGGHSLLPPSRYGGNLDIRHLTAGATIYLPVGVDGGLLSLGDAHATMGDGEVCGTGVETSARALLEVTLVPGAAPKSPVLETAPLSNRTGPALITTGIGPDLAIAAGDATRAMIDEISRRTGISPAHAYILVSIAGDLVVSQIVNKPQWTVSLLLGLDNLN